MDEKTENLELGSVCGVPACNSDELKMSDRQVFKKVMGQFAMGASIGSVFTSALFISNAGAFNIVLNSTSSVTTLIVLVLGISFYFGFGAAITGFVLIVSGD